MYSLLFTGCCIYSKPRMFGESSSEDSDSSGDETDHCKGHKGKCYQHSGGGVGAKQDTDRGGAPGIHHHPS